MTQTTQYDKNPSAEGAAARVSRTGATPSLSTDTFTSWPPLGTHSHKIVATGAAAATVGLPATDRPAAATGDIWSARTTIRNGAGGSRAVALLIVFYDTVGATLGTALATATVSATLAAGQISTLSASTAAAPAGTASVDVQVSRAAGTGAATSDPVHFDKTTLTKTPSPLDYQDPASNVFATWNSTTDASTQTYWAPTLAATPETDANPMPRIIVTVDDLPPGITNLTLERTAEGRTAKVRGAIAQAVVSGFSIPDVEAAGECSYRAHLYSGAITAPVDQGYTSTASATLTMADCWVHNPLDPHGGTIIDIADTSGKTLTRKTDGETFKPEGRTLAVLISGRRRGLEGVDFYFSTDDDQVAAKFEAMLGGYNDDDQQVPVLCIRTPAFTDWPRTFFAAFMSVDRKPITVHMGGSLREWEASADETAPPAPGLVVALLTRDDIDAFYATRNAIDAAYASRTAIDRDYSKAGTAT